MSAAADGSVFMSDWCDAGECHDYDDIHRENGRIYKIAYGSPDRRNRDLSRSSDAELVALLSAKNDWDANHARLLLQERAAAGRLDTQTRHRCWNSSTRRVAEAQALWALHVTGGTDEALAFELLRSGDPWLRAWIVQLALESPQPSKALRDRLADLAAEEPSPTVRLYLASALQRLTPAERLPLALALAARVEDSDDPNLPLVTWYGIEPLVSTDSEAATKLLLGSRVPLLRQFIAQRLGLQMSLEPVAGALRSSPDSSFKHDVVRGLFEALNGRRHLTMPPSWPQVASALRSHPDEETREKGLLLSLVFDDPGAADRVRDRVSDRALSPGGSTTRAAGARSGTGGASRAPAAVPAERAVLARHCHPRALRV